MKKPQTTSSLGTGLGQFPFASSLTSNGSFGSSTGSSTSGFSRPSSTPDTTPSSSFGGRYGSSDSTFGQPSAPSPFRQLPGGIGSSYQTSSGIDSNTNKPSSGFGQPSNATTPTTPFFQPTVAPATKTATSTGIASLNHGLFDKMRQASAMARQKQVSGSSSGQGPSTARSSFGQPAKTPNATPSAFTLGTPAASNSSSVGTGFGGFPTKPNTASVAAAAHSDPGPRPVAPHGGMMSHLYPMYAKALLIWEKQHEAFVRSKSLPGNVNASSIPQPSNSGFGARSAGKSSMSIFNKISGGKSAKIKSLTKQFIEHVNNPSVNKEVQDTCTDLEMRVMCNRKLLIGNVEALHETLAEWVSILIQEKSFDKLKADDIRGWYRHINVLVELYRKNISKPIYDNLEKADMLGVFDRCETIYDAFEGNAFSKYIGGDANGKQRRGADDTPTPTIDQLDNPISPHLISLTIQFFHFCGRQ